MTHEERLESLENTLSKALDCMTTMGKALAEAKEENARLYERNREVMAFVALIAAKRLGMSQKQLSALRDTACLVQKQAHLEWQYSGEGELPDVDDPLN